MEEQVLVQPKNKGGKLKLILMIGIPVLVIVIVAGIIAGITISKNNKYEEALECLEDGDFEEAVELHKELGDYKDLEEEICEEALDAFKKQMKKNAYKKALEIYDAVKDYSEATKDMETQLKKHLVSLIDERDYDSISSLCKLIEKNKIPFEGGYQKLADELDDLLQDWNFRTAAEVYKMLPEQHQEQAEVKFAEYADDMLRIFGVYDFQNFWYVLRDEDLLLDSVKEALYVNCVELIENGWYDEAREYLYMLVDCNYKDSATVMEELIFQDTLQQVDECLTYQWYGSAMDIINQYNGDYWIRLMDHVYAYGCQLLEGGAYSDARDLFDYMGDYADSREKYEEANTYIVIQDLIWYLDNGHYDNARYMVNQYSGAVYERMLEVYLSYSGDNTFLADLEAALVTRINNALNDTYSMEELWNAEWEALEHYRNMAFYDERLGDLAYDYLEALERQGDILSDMNYGYLDYYEGNYRWSLAAADRYRVLDALYSEYGFGENQPVIMDNVIGVADSMTHYYETWWEIHCDLKWQLWGMGAITDSNGNYYLEYCNYTNYTFSIYVLQEFTDYNNNTISSLDGEYVEIDPGERVKIWVTFPEDFYYNNWYIDWSIYNIYADGVLLG